MSDVDTGKLNPYAHGWAQSGTSSDGGLTTVVTSHFYAPPPRRGPKMANEADVDTGKSLPPWRDERYQTHLAECVECWQVWADFEKREGADLRLPPRPTETSSEARQTHER